MHYIVYGKSTLFMEADDEGNARQQAKAIGMDVEKVEPVQLANRQPLPQLPTTVATSDGETVTEQLREKIKSKMEVGKFFAGFLTFLTGFLLKESPPVQLWSKVGIVLLGASIGFCIAAVFAYDRLLMPRKYWRDLHADDKTEQRFQNALQANMASSWLSLFVPAVVCFGLGFVLVLIPALKLTGSERSQGWSAEDVFLSLSLAVAALSPIFVGFLKRPKIHY
jgi:hypothetical protein